MIDDAPSVAAGGVRAFLDLCGTAVWRERLRDIRQEAARRPRRAQALMARHAVELALARQAAGSDSAGGRAASLAEDAVALAESLPASGRARLRQRLAQGLTENSSLMGMFHLLHVAALQRQRGFVVHAAGLADEAPFDLLLQRQGAEAELACETVQAEDGRDLHRTAWFHLVDGLDPDLQTWLSAHPGRYLLKMTLPNGLRLPDTQDALCSLSGLQRRIREMLEAQRRQDQDEAAVLRLDPLLVAGAQAGDMGLMDALRRQFGPEAQLAVTRSGSGVFVMAARAGRQNDIAAAVHRHLSRTAFERFTGTRPAILSVFVDGAEQTEWLALRDSHELEQQVRHFLTSERARGLIAVSAASCHEVLGGPAPVAAEEGELRFRNHSHKAARSTALAPSVISTR